MGKSVSTCNLHGNILPFIVLIRSVFYVKTKSWWLLIFRLMNSSSQMPEVQVPWLKPDLIELERHCNIKDVGFQEKEWENTGNKRLRWEWDLVPASRCGGVAEDLGTRSWRHKLEFQSERGERYDWKAPNTAVQMCWQNRQPTTASIVMIFLPGTAFTNRKQYFTMANYLTDWCNL